MSIRARAWGALGLLALLAGGRAHAADACLDAPVRGQKLQRAGHLLAARDQFEACAQKGCPSEIVHDCTGWMQDVTKAIPSIVAVARDPSGADVLDATLAIDDKAPAPLGARAIELDPGTHRLVFHRDGAPDVARDVVLREGEKDREIVAVLGTAAAPSVQNAPSTPAASASPPSSADTEKTPSRPVPVSAWIAAGVGVAAMATFGVVGGMGVSSRASNHCDSGCDAASKNTVDTEFMIADVALGVGLVALGVATWLYLTRESVPAPVAAVLGVLGAPTGGSVGVRF